MNFDFSKAIEWFESTGFYKDLLSKLPTPLNNPVLCGIILIVILIFIVFSVIEHINNYRIRRRIKKKNREYEEKRIDDKIKAAEEKEQSKDMEKYLQFMMMAQMQNMTSMQNLSFDQWKRQSEEGSLPQPEPITKEEPIVKLDAITGLFNETAFTSALENYETSELSIITISINRAKKGHLSESDILKTVADMMCEVWGKNKCYRTGNAEFTAISTKEYRRSIEKDIHTFKDFLGDLSAIVAVGLADASDVEGRATADKIRKASVCAMCTDRQSSKKKTEDSMPVEVTGLAHIVKKLEKE